MLKYYSSWILILSTIWYICYLLNLPLIKYIDPYYSIVLMCYGFVVFLVYLKLYKKYQFNLSFLISISALHFIPLIVIYKLPRGKYTTETLVISFFLYTMYLAYINKDIYTVYLVDKHPKNWDDVKDVCRLKKENNLPICIIIDILESIFDLKIK